jgi:hypothetical protein
MVQRTAVTTIDGATGRHRRPRMRGFVRVVDRGYSRPFPSIPEPLVGTSHSPGDLLNTRRYGHSALSGSKVSISIPPISTAKWSSTKPSEHRQSSSTVFRPSRSEIR